jgi:hypothetical protein
MWSAARNLSLWMAALGAWAAVGCGGPPPLHPVTGKITLGGKGYQRLIVYFRPAAGNVTEFNLGVGETDASGNLTLRSTGGPGLQAGEYKVTFTCMVPKSGPGNLKVSDKPDDNRTVAFVELVPQPYDDGTSAEATPLRFTVKPGQENRYNFDIPAKK